LKERQPNPQHRQPLPARRRNGPPSSGRLQIRRHSIGRYPTCRHSTDRHSTDRNHDQPLTITHSQTEQTSLKAGVARNEPNYAVTASAEPVVHGP
jgi:hypothetical protein